MQMIMRMKSSIVVEISKSFADIERRKWTP